MQGIESLDNFKKFVSSLGGLGRYEDTYIVHAAEGETVVPMEVLDQNPALKKRLFQSMIEMGIEPGRYIVGNELNSKNPVTGQPEFFLKKIVSQIRKALPGDTEQFLGPIVGLATGNPFLGALAGAVGSGTEGAITGGLTGFRSPGIEGLGGKFGRDLLGTGFGGEGKIGPMSVGEIFKKGGIGQFIKGKEGEGSGLLGSDGKFLGFGGGGGEEAGKTLLTPEIEKFLEETPEGLKIIKKIKDVGGDPKKLSGSDYLKYTILLGLVLDRFEGDKGPVGMPLQELPEGQAIQSILNPIAVSPGMAEGGVMDLRQGGESEGPGTGTSDDIPAMLSDGEFVMTAKAVRGAGGGDRREGAKRMYQMMDNLEARA